MTPTTAPAEISRIQQTVFDLDSKGDVTLFKDVAFSAVSTTQEALARVGNDAKAFLAIINDGLRAYASEQARLSSDPWYTEDDEGNCSPFNGRTLTPEKSKQFGINVLNMAKMLFGYVKEAKPEIKRAAKQSATDMLLANPVVIEALSK